MLPPVLDMEWNPFSPTCAHRRPEASVVQDEMRRWLRIVEAHYGQKPIIYTTPRFMRRTNSPVSKATNIGCAPRQKRLAKPIQVKAGVSGSTH